MGTRGCIARKTAGGFAGRYHHWDSYPLGLGKMLWDLYHDHFNRDLDRMLAVLIDEHPAGWASIDGDWRQPPGFGVEGPRCFCHGGRTDSESLITEVTASSVGCEWAYVFEGDQMAVLSSFRLDGRKMIGMFGAGDPEAVWRCLRVIDLSGDEPDWGRIG
jgi:hypothetical protein